MRIQLKKTARFVWKAIRYTIAVTLAFLIVGSGLLFWHLHQRPLNLAFLMPQIEKHLIAKNSPLHLSVGSIELTATMNRWGLFHVQAQNVSLMGPDNAVIMDLPSVRVSYGIQHILTFNYMPSNIRIKDALLQLTLTKDNHLLLQDQDTPQEKELKEQAGVTALADEGIALPSIENANQTHSTTQGENLNPAAIVKGDMIVINDLDKFSKYLLGFRRLALEHASVIIDDEKTGKRISIPDLNFSLKRRRMSQYDLSTQMQLVFQDAQPMNFDVSAELNETAKTITFEFLFDQLNLSRGGRIAEMLGGLDVLLQGKVMGEMNFSQKEDTLRKAVKKLSFVVQTMGEGKVRLPDPLNVTYPVKEITATGVFTDNLDQLLIRPIKASLTTGLSADVDIVIDGAGLFLETFDFNQVKTTLNARMHNIPIEQVPDVWPSYLGPDAHAWVKANLSNGGATTALFTLYFTGPEITDLLGDIDFKGVTVRYLDKMSPVVEAAGKVMLYPDKVEIFADTGYVGNVTLQAANVYLTELLDDVSNAKIELAASGPVPEVMALLDSQPLDLIKSFGIKPDKTQGAINGQVTLHFPLIETLKAEEVQADVSASVTNGVFPTPVDDIVVQNGAFELQVNNDGLVVNGKGTLQGIPVDLKWEEFFVPTKTHPTQSIYTVAGSFTENEIKPYFPDADSYLSGRFKTQAIIKKNMDGALTVNTTTDLANAQVVLYPISYTKGQGKPSTFGAEIFLTASNALSMVRFNLEADGQTNIKGNYVVNDGGWTMRLDQVKTPDSSFSGVIQTSPTQDLSMQIKGSSWNMTEIKETPFIKNSLPDPTAETQMPGTDIIPPNLTLNISLDSLLLMKEAPLKHVAVKANRTGFQWNELFIFAQGREATSITLTPATGKIEGLSGDVGDLLKRLGFSDQFSKGTAVLSGTQLTNGGFTGRLKLKNLNIKEPGFIMQAVTILGIWDAIRGKDLIFSHGNIPFDLSPNFTLFVKDGVTYGTTLGITFSGRASMDALALTGSVIPAYVLNSLPGRIPLIGTLFKDTQGGGLMGVKYDLTGTPGNPRVRFNPLSSIAPGILGRLFQ